MRNINWDAPLSDEDVAWVRQAGVLDEERIARHQEQFEAKVPEVKETPDTNTRSALDPTARIADPIHPDSGPIDNSLPIGGDESDEDESDDLEEEQVEDYTKWSVPDLEEEVDARNAMPNTSEVPVTGTGKDGKVVKADLVKGLRLWDDENPRAFDKN